MVKTAISILVALGIIVGVSYLEVWQVNRAFSIFREALVALYKKTESEQATHEDGKSVRMLWEKEKRTLYFWLSHTVIENIDYQLNESLGYLYEGAKVQILETKKVGSATWGKVSKGWISMDYVK